VAKEKRIRKCAGEKHVFTQKTPVDGPFEKKLSTKVECAAQVFSALAFNDEGKCRGKLVAL
jgi:hypothetical protein